MPRIFLFLLFSMVLCFSTKAQTLDSIRIQRLETKLQQLEEKIFLTDSIQYANQYQVAYESYFLYDQLNYKAADFYKSIKNESFLVALLNINNPNTLELQKRILQEVQQLVENKVTDLLGKDSTKKRGIFKIIRNIIHNPIVQKVAGFIPFTNTISTILSTINGIVDADVDIVQNATRKIIEKTVHIKSIFDNSPLSEIASKIAPYMQFYDSLTYLNNKFSFAMDILKSKAAEMVVFVNDNRAAFINLSGWDAQKTMLARMEIFDNLFLPAKQVRNNARFTATQIAKLQEFYTVAAPISATYTNFLRLKKEYDAKFSDMKKEYTDLLERFQNKNKIFSEVLSNALVSIQKIDQPEVIMMMTPPDALQTMALPKNEKEKRQQELQMEHLRLLSKYAEPYNAKTEKIKKVLF
jgi:hypothetical protein